MPVSVKVESRAMRARMTNMGEIGGRSGVINSDKRNQKAKFCVALLASQAEIAETENVEKDNKEKGCCFGLG